MLEISTKRVAERQPGLSFNLYLNWVPSSPSPLYPPFASLSRFSSERDWNKVTPARERTFICRRRVSTSQTRVNYGDVNRTKYGKKRVKQKKTRWIYSAKLNNGKRYFDMPVQLFHFSERFNRLFETVAINYVDLETTALSIINEPSSVVI